MSEFCCCNFASGQVVDLRERRFVEKYVDGLQLGAHASKQAIDTRRLRSFSLSKATKMLVLNLGRASACPMLNATRRPALSPHASGTPPRLGLPSSSEVKIGSGHTVVSTMSSAAFLKVALSEARECTKNYCPGYARERSRKTGASHSQNLDLGFL